MANLSNINGKFVVEQTTGYVGVGTTDPNYPIEVLNASAEIALNASGGSIYRVQSDSASNFIIRKAGVGDRLIISSAGNATFAGTVTAGGADDATALFLKRSGGANVMAINTSANGSWTMFDYAAGTYTSGITQKSGNVGIGTTSPDFALDIEAVSSGVQLQIGRTVTSAGSTWMGSDSNGFHLGVGAYGAGNSVSDPNGFSVDTSGNVGIGTTSPTYPLTLSGGAANTNPGTVEAPYIGEELAFKIENPGWSSTNGLIRMIQPAGAYVNNASMTFSTLQGSLTEKMRIENNGNVGIGTTSPSSKLHVVGGATNSQHIVRGPYTVGLSGNSLGNATFTAAFNFNGFYNTGYTIEVYALFNHWNSSTANYTYCYRKALLFGYNAAGAAQIDGPGGGVSNSVNVGAWTFSVDNNGVTGYAQRILATKSAGNAAWHGTYWIQIVSSVPLDPLDVS